MFMGYWFWVDGVVSVIVGIVMAVGSLHATILPHATSIKLIFVGIVRKEIIFEI
jgi:uncharacterized membrane protein HdeD (DUF308 family)